MSDARHPTAARPPAEPAPVRRALLLFALATGCGVATTVPLDPSRDGGAVDGGTSDRIEDAGPFDAGDPDAECGGYLGYTTHDEGVPQTWDCAVAPRDAMSSFHNYRHRYIFVAPVQRVGCVAYQVTMDLTVLDGPNGPALSKRPPLRVAVCNECADPIGTELTEFPGGNTARSGIAVAVRDTRSEQRIPLFCPTNLVCEAGSQAPSVAYDGTHELHLSPGQVTDISDGWIDQFVANEVEGAFEARGAFSVMAPAFWPLDGTPVPLQTGYDHVCARAGFVRDPSCRDWSNVTPYDPTSFVWLDLEAVDTPLPIWRALHQDESACP